MAIPPLPPLRVMQANGVNQIPVFELEFSGGTLTSVSPIKVMYTPPGSGGTGGAPTGARYVVLALDATLSGEEVLTAGNSIVITTGGAGGNVSMALSVPVSAASGGTGVASPTAYSLLSGSGASALYSIGTMPVGSILVGSGPNQHPMILNTAGQGLMVITSAGRPGGLAWVNTGASSSVVYAPTGGFYLAYAADGNLSAEKVVTAGSSVTITTDATALYITANTPNVSGFQSSIAIPLIVGSGGTGLTAAGTANSLLGVNSSGTVLEYKVLLAGNSVTLGYSTTAITINAVTGQAITYAPTGGAYVSYIADGALSSEKVLTAGSSVTIVTDATAIYISAVTSPPGGVTYAPTGGFYVAWSSDTLLSNEKILTAGNNVSITTDGTTITIAANTGSGDGIVYAPTGGFYVAYTSDAALASEKILTAGSSVTITTDSTAIYISAITNPAGSSIVYAPTGGNYAVFAADANLSSEKVITAGSSVTITTDSTAIYINALTNAAGGVVYAPTGGAYVSYVADAGLSAEKTLTAGSSVTITTDATAIYINALTNAAGGIVYAPTGGNYIAFAADAALSSEKVLTAGSSVTISTDATAVYITAVTGPIITASTGLTSTSNAFSVNTNIRDKAYGFYAAGTLASIMNAEGARSYIPFNMDMQRIQLAAQDTPGGQAVIIDLRQYNGSLSNSVSISTAAIAAAASTGSSTTFAVATLYAGSFLGFNVSQIGTTNTGGNLTITVIARAS